MGCHSVPGGRVNADAGGERCVAGDGREREAERMGVG